MPIGLMFMLSIEIKERAWEREQGLRADRSSGFREVLQPRSAWRLLDAARSRHRRRMRDRKQLLLPERPSKLRMDPSRARKRVPYASGTASLMPRLRRKISAGRRQKSQQAGAKSLTARARQTLPSNSRTTRSPAPKTASISTSMPQRAPRSSLFSSMSTAGTTRPAPRRKSPVWILPRTMDASTCRSPTAWGSSASCAFLPSARIPAISRCSISQRPSTGSAPISKPSAEILAMSRYQASLLAAVMSWPCLQAPSLPASSTRPSPIREE